MSGLILSQDARDSNYKFETVETAPFSSKEWWADGWQGNQGNTPHCGAYSWMHAISDGPVFQKTIVNNPLMKPKQFYDLCKDIDELKGEGTTLHATAKVAKNLGIVSEYRWVNDLDNLVLALLVHGPVIAGTNWYQGMSAPENGKMKIKGSMTGGHAYVINGVDVNKKLFRIKNSYGKLWGKNGHAYLSFSDMERLIKEKGLFLVPFIQNVEKIPH